jgi:prenyltransferase beta subunit
MRPALVLVFLCPLPLAAQSADAKKATVQFLAGLQQPDGGFIAAPADPKADAPPRSSLRATSAAVRAIKYLGGEVPHAGRAAEFVLSCYDPKAGGFADQPKGTPDVSVTAIGMMAAAELYADRLDPAPSNRFLANNAKSFEERRLAVAGMEAGKAFAPVIKDWFDEVRRTANPDGTYGKGDAQARETGGVVAMFLRAGEKLPDDQRKAVIAALQAGQRADGGFGKPGDKGSDGETTYRVMRAFHLLKEKPKDVAKVREFIGKCRNADGGYGVAPQQPSTVSGSYYAAVVSKWLME